jgi:hypothetical protein
MKDLVNVVVGFVVIFLGLFTCWLVGLGVCHMGFLDSMCSDPVGTGLLGLMSALVLLVAVGTCWAAGQGIRDSLK